MLTIKDGKVVLDDIPARGPWEMAATSDKALPADCPIGTSIFVVDKVDVVFCDGENNWYREADKPMPAGNPISTLF